jgi:FG-GAP-like repeat
LEIKEKSMKVSFLKLRFFAVLAVGVAFLVSSSLLVSAQQTRKSISKIVSKKSKVAKSSKKVMRNKKDDDKTPWEGEAGVSKTMAELMIEQSKSVRSTEIENVKERKRIRPDRKNLPQNEESPLIEKFPVDPTTTAVKEVAPNIAPQSPQTVGLNFNGGTLFDTLSFPPDTMGDVGPSQYIMTVNGWIRSFNKTTGTADGVMDIDIDQFFTSVRNGISTSDPRIRYDRLSQRWIIAIINVANTDNRILIAVSNTQNITPATVWTYYFFVNSAVSPAGDAGCFADYPSLGVDANALYIGTNNFCPNNFGGTTGFVVRKNSILSGGPIVATAFRGLVAGAGAGAGLYTPQGVDNFDPAATVGYFIGVDNATFGTLKLRRVTDPGGTPTISADINLAVPATQYAATVPHLGNTAGTNGNLDVLDDRLYMAHLRNGRIYTSHNIGVNASGVATASGRAGSRWYEIDNVATTPTLRQSGTWFDSAATNPKSFWIPSIMVSGQGHIALGGSSAGANDRINAATIGRLSNDPLGTLQSSLTYTTSATAYNPAGDSGGTSGRRFGDYSYTSIDPEDDMTMWTIQEWNHATNSYAMRVAKLLAPPPATPASASPATAASGQSSVNVTITGTVANGSGFFEPGPTFAKHIAATVSGGVTVNSVTYTSPTQITLNLSTVGATAGTKDVTVTNPDGQALTGTALITITGSPSAGIKIPADFDGDGKTDISTFRNVSGAGTWYSTNSSNGAFAGTTFGFGTDIIAPADYDGDNKTDVAVFRNGVWYLLKSSNGAFQAFSFGQAADKPTPGDFDGDGKADFAVFRPSNGTWYITQSSDSAFVARQFGVSGDIPVFGRYDSDTKDDLAVFRGNTWYITQSTNNAFVGFQFGASGDIPTAGDYDGDGKYDYAVFRPSNGTWYITQSSNGAFRGQQFGQNADIPVPGNYDGDNKFDFAVFRTGTWYTQGNVSGAFSAAAFGLPTDKPVPSAYIQ